MERDIKTEIFHEKFNQLTTKEKEKIFRLQQYLIVYQNMKKKEGSDKAY